MQSLVEWSSSWVSDNFFCSTQPDGQKPEPDPRARAFKLVPGLGSNKKLNSTLGFGQNVLSSSTRHSKENRQFDQSKHALEVTVNAFFVNEKEWLFAESYTFKFFEDLINWVAKKQATVFIFTIEIELLTLLHEVKEFVKWTHLFNRLNFDSEHDLIIMKTICR
jgi:hypothetical protein